MLTWIKNDETNVRTAESNGVVYRIIPQSGGYFRLEVNGGWEGSRSSLTKLQTIAEGLDSASQPVSPMNDVPVLTMDYAASKKGKKPPVKSQGKNPNPKEQPKEQPKAEPKPEPTPQETPAEEPKKPAKKGKKVDTIHAGGGIMVDVVEPEKLEPVKYNCELCTVIARDNPELSPTEVIGQCQVCSAPKSRATAKPSQEQPKDDSPELQPSEGVSDGSPDEPQPEPRSSKGLKKLAAVAGKSPIPLPEDVGNRQNLLAWCENVRDHFEEQGKFLTVPALMVLVRSEAKNVAEGAALALKVKGIYDREVKAVAKVGDTPQTPKGDTQPQQSPAPKAKAVISESENGKVSQGTGGGKRYDLFGHPVTGVLRWMGKQGWKFAQARAALDKLGIDCADGTLTAQLGAGAKGKRGDPSPVTPEQAAKLTAAAGGAK
jgi:hypothetical protein